MYVITIYAYTIYIKHKMENNEPDSDFRNFFNLQTFSGYDLKKISMICAAFWYAIKVNHRRLTALNVQDMVTQKLQTRGT